MDEARYRPENEHLCCRVLRRKVGENITDEKALRRQIFGGRVESGVLW
jgi:hypothetical protein